jgi:hypothetical protein
MGLMSIAPKSSTELLRVVPLPLRLQLLLGTAAPGSIEARADEVRLAFCHCASRPVSFAVETPSSAAN